MLIACSQFFSFVCFSPSPRRERHRSKSPRRHRSRSRDRRHRSKSPGTLDTHCSTRRWQHKRHEHYCVGTSSSSSMINSTTHTVFCPGLSWWCVDVCTNMLSLWTRSPQKPQTSQPLQDSREVSVFIHISTNTVVYFLMAVPLNMFLNRHHVAEIFVLIDSSLSISCGQETSCILLKVARCWASETGSKVNMLAQFSTSHWQRVGH